MDIFNVRFGLATNSSSSHSLIFLNDNNVGDTHSALPEDGNEDIDAEYAEFGWDYFTAASETAKKSYLAVLLASELTRDLPSSIANVLVEDWLGGFNVPANGYIDHQSLIHLPKEMVQDDYRTYSFVSKKFFNEFAEFILRPELKILGGNDNDGIEHPLAERQDAIPVSLPIPIESNGWMCRKDEVYNYWTLFNTNTGSKVRFRFTRGDMRNIPKRASAPELVDVKITNFCPFNCEFCYQDSVPEGVHADGTSMYRVISRLSKAQVFEVALGGGEPTMHPNFIGILKDFKRAGITPNFTTKNLAWLREPAKIHEIMENIGAFAYSAQNPTEIDKLNALLVNAGIKGDRWPYGYETKYNQAKVTIHIVMGTLSSYDFSRLLKTCHAHKFGVTLLGYKTVGRGNDVVPINYDWWLENVAQLKETNNCPPIGIDTVMAQKYENDLVQAGIPDILYNTQEGTFSCYIDATTNKMGPSSFCDPEAMVDFDDDYLTTFQGF